MDYRVETTPWDLWNLRTLLPRAAAGELATLNQERERMSRYENQALHRLTAGDIGLLDSGRQFLANNPELNRGLIVTMHMGPYQFLLEPFLHAGISPGILLNEAAYDRFKVEAEQMRTGLRLPGVIDWIPIDSPYFLRRVIATLRQHRPVIVFLDGNGGLGGSRRTRERGMLYTLPGREIRVRTGLGRLIGKLECPVHPVCLRWEDRGEIGWSKAGSQQWRRTDEPEQITRLLYDWGFAEVLAAPEQWTFWNMLTESYDCFTRHRLDAGFLPPAVREDFRRAFEICLARSPATVHVKLDKAVEVWPADVLANLTDDCFYAAEGLLPEELRFLDDTKPSLGELCRRFDRDWVRFHVLRLCLLDLAHLSGG